MCGDGPLLFAAPAPDPPPRVAKDQSTTAALAPLGAVLRAWCCCCCWPCCAATAAAAAAIDNGCIGGMGPKGDCAGVWPYGEALLPYGEVRYGVPAYGLARPGGTTPLPPGGTGVAVWLPAGGRGGSGGRGPVGGGAVGGCACCDGNGSCAETSRGNVLGGGGLEPNAAKCGCCLFCGCCCSLWAAGRAGAWAGAGGGWAGAVSPCPCAAGACAWAGLGPSGGQELAAGPVRDAEARTTEAASAGPACLCPWLPPEVLRLWRAGPATAVGPTAAAPAPGPGAVGAGAVPATTWASVTGPEADRAAGACCCGGCCCWRAGGAAAVGLAAGPAVDPRPAVAAAGGAAGAGAGEAAGRAAAAAVRRAATGPLAGAAAAAAVGPDVAGRMGDATPRLLGGCCCCGWGAWASWVRGDCCPAALPEPCGPAAEPAAGAAALPCPALAGGGGTAAAPPFAPAAAGPTPFADAAGRWSLAVGCDALRRPSELSTDSDLTLPLRPATSLPQPTPPSAPTPPSLAVWAAGVDRVADVLPSGSPAPLAPSPLTAGAVAPTVAADRAALLPAFATGASPPLPALAPPSACTAAPSSPAAPPLPSAPSALPSSSPSPAPPSAGAAVVAAAAAAPPFF